MFLELRFDLSSIKRIVCLPVKFVKLLENQALFEK